MNYEEHLLNCAEWYHHHKPTVQKLPEFFDSEDQLFESMLESLLYEAHESIQEKIDLPERPVLNAVDLETDEPGIISATVGSNLDISRKKKSKPCEIKYSRISGMKTLDKSKEIEISEKKIDKLLLSAHNKLQKKIGKDQDAAAMHFMTKEEKAFERKRKKQESDAEKTRKKEEKDRKARVATTKDQPSVEALDELQEAMGDDDTQNQSHEPSLKPEQNKKEISDKPVKPKKEKEINYESVVTSADSLKPPRKNKDEVVIHPSPLPFDRHMTALTASGACKELRSTLLCGEPKKNKHLRIIEGPPGTGKTTKLIEDIVDFAKKNPDNRILVCSPTNVGICDLYSRAVKQKVVGHLMLSKQHTLDGVPVNNFVSLEDAKFVFCTFSGRSSPKMWHQSFSALFMDEAAQCPESIAWGVIRPDVKFIYMVGDTQQLSSIVSPQGKLLGHDKSLMERLIKMGVESEILTTQRRMHPQIVKYPNVRFYENKLTSIGTDYKTSQNPYEVHNVPGKETRIGTSYENESEAEYAIGVATDLAKLYSNVCIITPYLGQNRRLMSYKCNVPVYTVDSFQGKEADVIILCIVRTSQEGFWSDARRLNVALTRAKKILRVICDASSHTAGEIGSLVSDARKRNLLL